MNAPVRAPLRGEILPPDDVLIVTAAMHPLRTEHEPVLVPAGSSVSEIVLACGHQARQSRLSDSAYVEVNGQAVPERLWPHVRVKAGNHVMVKAVPKGFVVPLALSVAQLAVGSITLTSFLTSIVTAGIGINGPLMSDGLFPMEQPK